VAAWGLPAVGHKEVSTTACPGTWWPAWKEWINGGITPAPPEEPVTITYKWYDGSDATEAVFRAEFGNYPITPGGDYHVSELQAITGPSTFRFRVLDEAGNPVVGQKVVFSWPDAPACPGAGYGDKGVIGETKETGWAEFGMGTGAYYQPWLGETGPHSAWVYGGNSDFVGGIGMLWATEHDHFDVTVRPGAVPEPPGDTYTLKVEIVGQGVVTVNPLLDCYPKDTKVTLTAIPAVGWKFVDWTSDIANTFLENPLVTNMGRSKILTATFIESGEPPSDVEALIAEAQAEITEADAHLERAYAKLEEARGLL
jgi:hypothetical protein